jgi:hypothetical protein
MNQTRFLMQEIIFSAGHMAISATPRTRCSVHRFICAILGAALITACGNASSGNGGSATAADPPAKPISRARFLGAFFRPIGMPPYGVFSVFSKQRAPEPYPAPHGKLFGTAGYCDAVASNGMSISSGFKVDAAKLNDVIDLGVKWTRTPVSADFDDHSHLFGPGKYEFGDFDSAQCALVRVGIEPVVGLEAGTVQYNENPEGFSPRELPIYKTAADFGAWCGAVAQHERATFPSVSRYSLPGNEVNIPDGRTFTSEKQIAGYSLACYRAIKHAQPKSVVYGFELSMEKDLDVPAFVRRMAALGCKLGNCYDAISLHLFMHYPLPAPATPCYPHDGGAYSMQCITDIQAAAGDPAMHVLIGETAFTIPGSVPDEATKAKAIVDAMQQFAANRFVDGVSYANVDECDSYPSGFFMGGCLVDSIGKKLPAYDALRSLATAAYN